MKTTQKNHLRSPISLLVPILAALCLLGARPASGVMVMWIGTNGVSPNVNWSNPNNWCLASSLTSPSTPVSDAANFTGITAATGPGITTVNIDGAYNSPGSGNGASYGAFFGQTNGYHTVVINPGLTWLLGAGTAQPSGGQGIGIEVGPQITNNNNTANFNTVSTGITWTNYTTITGIGGTIYNNAGASSSGAVRVEGASTVANNHYSILDMSGLGTFFVTNSVGLASTAGFYVVEGGQNSQALCYLALTNVILLNNNFVVGDVGGTAANTLPIGVYLGQSNYITTGANNNNFVIGSTNCVNGFLTFNPSFAGESPMPTVSIAGSALTGNNAGPQNATICSAAGGSVAGSAVCDFTEGVVTWIGSTLKMGVSGSGSTSANGTLNFNNGLVAFNNILVGDQSVSGGAAGVGTINIGTNATLLASNVLTLGAVTGTANAGTAGTININTNGTLQASTITNGGAGSTINLTNANLTLALTSTSVTNVTVANVNARGTTNIINITSIPAFLGGSLPVRFHLIATGTPANLVGASTFGLGTLPVSFNPFYPYAGYLDTTTTPGLVDFVLTAAPPSARSLIWAGTSGGNPDGIWDVSTNYDWETNGVATYYNQLDIANFYDVSASADTSVSLSTPLSPSSITVSNNTSVYTIGLPSDPGYLTGSTGITKQGTGTLILDNGVSNSFTGAVTISGGTLQVGNVDNNGNLPASAAVTDNSLLAFAPNGSVTVANVISGSGSVMCDGGGQLNLSGANSFTGNAIATSNSILQSGAGSAWGAAVTNAIIISNGSTFDPNGFPTPRSIIVSGSGVNGEGAIVNSGGPIYDSGTVISPSITLAGDTTFSYPTRWDYGLTTGTQVFSTGGQPYNLTMNGTANNSYFEWRDVAADPALANIDVVAGYFGIVGTTTLGNTTSSTLSVEAGANIKLYNVSSTQLVNIAKPLMLHGSSEFLNESGSNTISGPITLLNDNSGYCVIDVIANVLVISGPLSGGGILWEQPANVGPLVITGNASSFSGGALVQGGSLGIGNVFGSGVTSSSGTTVFGNGTVEGAANISGNLLPGATNEIGTFTAADGLTLQGGASLIMNLTANTGVGGTNNSLVVVDGNLNPSGNNIYINPIGTLANGTYTLMTYTGNLNGSFGTVQTLNANGWNGQPYNYSFTLNTSVQGQVQLVVGGAPTPATIAVNASSISGTNITLMGTGGLPNGTYRVFTSTNLAIPLSQWTKVGSNVFDINGNFNFPAAYSTNGVAQFYILEEP